MVLLVIIITFNIDPRGMHIIRPFTMIFSLRPIHFQLRNMSWIIPQLFLTCQLQPLQGAIICFWRGSYPHTSQRDNLSRKQDPFYDHKYIQCDWYIVVALAHSSPLLALTSFYSTELSKAMEHVTDIMQSRSFAPGWRDNQSIRCSSSDIHRYRKAFGFENSENSWLTL